MNFPFSFSVVYYCGEYVESSCDNSDNICTKMNYIRENGMGICTSFADAMAQIEEYYGSDLMSVKNLELYEENKLILLPQKTIDEYASTDFGIVGMPCDAKGNLIPLTPYHQEEEEANDSAL